jgi:hypothetical protein
MGTQYLVGDGGIGDCLKGLTLRYNAPEIVFEGGRVFKTAVSFIRVLLKQKRDRFIGPSFIILRE